MEIDWTYVVMILLSGLRICLGGLRQDAVQGRMRDDFPFPCPDRSLWRSAYPPQSVHALRPGDIDVIAAIGDSLTAANGASTDNLYEIVFNENRGVSWAAGGQGDWRTFLTVPNLLKEMNPNLVGYSLGDGRVLTRAAQFNVAFGGAMDQDLMWQARRLYSRMRSDPRVDFQNHWKMISIMIGTNDVCTDVCFDKNQGHETHRKHLDNLIMYLRDNFPRVFVNLVSMPYIPDYATMTNPPYATCPMMQLVDCSCLFGGNDVGRKMANVTRNTLAFQQVEMEVAEKWKYYPKDDFTVVYQPTNLNSRYPRYPRYAGNLALDNHDYTYVAIDCIHFTQKLHASVANTYWNNLFEVAGNKTSEWIVPAYSKFLCPTHYQPYLATSVNSENEYLNNQIFDEHQLKRNFFEY